MVRSLAPLLYNSLYEYIPEADYIQTKYGKPVYVWSVIFNGACTDAAAELVSGYTAELDGTVTSIDVHMVSADALDKNAAAGAVRSVNILGIDADMTGFELETLACDATAGTTSVDTTATYSRVLQAWSNAWGSGGADAEGNITIKDAEGGNVNMTIAAASNETTSTRVFIPVGWRAKILDADIHPSNAVAANVPGGGVRVHAVVNDYVDTDRDVKKYITARMATGGGYFKWPFGHEVFTPGAVPLKIAFWQEAEDGDLLDSWSYEFRLLLWDEN